MRQERCPVNDVEADEKDWNDDDCSTLDQIRVPPAMEKLLYLVLKDRFHAILLKCNNLPFPLSDECVYDGKLE